MKNISLAAKYRPQTFESVVGQETIKAILSKAALEGKVAPAYLLSGTRGVGKTTIARIFAKALNCENAATRTNGEPCNACSACLRITQNAYVDVMEIDGASNRGIDDAKRIREAVQYAPLEGKYKIIIIDEAHMLTKEAFNALLKTLEEPPSYTSFILATTEAHKFPITIVSRCQHFVFKQVPEKTLQAHLKFVLESENWQYEEEAVHLLVKRAAGSVRDSMSLLGQALALSQNPLTAELTRNILGLAGKEILENLLTAIAENNTLLVAQTVQDMMSQGIDIVYFIRELAQLWRTFFLLKQYQNNALSLLSLTDDEAERYKQFSSKFSPSFIHSAWQMTLDSQRRIATSLEPAVALELFLINLALLPQLLPLRELQSDEINSQTVQTSQPAEKKNDVVAPKVEKSTTTEKAASLEEKIEIQENTHTQESVPTEEPLIKAEENLSVVDSPLVEESTVSVKDENDEKSEELSQDISVTDDKKKNERTYEAFLDFLATSKHTPLTLALRLCKGTFWEDNGVLILTLNSPSSNNSRELNTPVFHQSLQAALEKWADCKAKVEVHTVETPKARIELREELENHDLIKEIKKTFNAHITNCENKKVD